MNSWKIVSAALSIGALMTAATAAQQLPQTLLPAISTAPLETEDVTFLQHAARDGMAEVELAELARWKSANLELRALAARIENDHTNAHEQLRSLASRKDVVLPSGPDQLQSATTGRFSKMVGESFDRNYVNAMVTDHLRAVARFTAGTNSADPDVRAIAESMLRAVREHLRGAQSLQKTLK